MGEGSGHGSGRVNVSPGRVGSKKSDPWTTLGSLDFRAEHLYIKDLY